MMTIEERIKSCLSRNTEWTVKRISCSTGGTYTQIQAIKDGLPMPIVPTKISLDPIISSPDTGLVSLEKIIHRYDIKSAIYRELTLVPRGKLIAEPELCQRAAGTDKYRFRRAVENNEAEFMGLRIKLRLDDSSEGKWFWGASNDIAKALQIRDA